MVVDNKYERCDERDPNRCQGVTRGQSSRQCPFKAVENSKFCPMHGGTPQIDLNKKAALAQYRLQQYGQRVSDFANNPEVKNLREEIGILRMTLETVINQCENVNKLLIFSDKISSLVGQIQRLVECAQKLEERNNDLLDRKIVIVVADSIVTLIGQYVHDPDQINEIAGKICDTIETAASPTNYARAFTQSNNGA